MELGRERKSGDKLDDLLRKESNKKLGEERDCAVAKRKGK